MSNETFILCAGAVELLDVSKNEIYKLSSGILITIESEMVHEVGIYRRDKKREINC